MLMQMTQNVYQFKELFSTRMFRGLLAITGREWPACKIKQPQPPLNCVDPIKLFWKLSFSQPTNFKLVLATTMKRKIDNQ
jgi:hypothetical protein